VVNAQAYHDGYPLQGRKDQDHGAERFAQLAKSSQAWAPQAQISTERHAGTRREKPQMLHGQQQDRRNH